MRERTRTSPVGMPDSHILKLVHLNPRSRFVIANGKGWPDMSNGSHADERLMQKAVPSMSILPVWLFFFI